MKQIATPVYMLIQSVFVIVQYLTSFSFRNKSFHFTTDDVSRGLKQGFILLKAGQDVLFRIQSCLLLCGPPRHSRYFPTHP